MSPRLTFLLCALATSLTAPAQSTTPQPKGYYRTPSLWHNTIIFTAEGDLWKYDMTTRITARLTTHEGLETNPVIAPDGRNVAFTGQYEGAKRSIRDAPRWRRTQATDLCLDGSSRPRPG